MTKVAYSLIIEGGNWGVAPASEHQEILVALASLIRAQRYDMALTILDNELGGNSTRRVLEF